jgi:hypothetical protein
VSPLKLKSPIKTCVEYQQIHQVFIQFIMCGGSYMFRHYIAIAYHVTRHNTPIPNIRSTAPHWRIYWKALGALPEAANETPKHVGATIHN